MTIQELYDGLYIVISIFAIGFGIMWAIGMAYLFMIKEKLDDIEKKLEDKKE